MTRKAHPHQDHSYARLELTPTRMHARVKRAEVHNA
jgi:hypothetical protein